MLLLISSGIVYIGVGRLLVRRNVPGRGAAFGLLNLLAVYVFFFSRGDEIQFGLYVVLVALLYLLLWLWDSRSGAGFWAAFLAPIALLILVRYGPENILGRSLASALNIFSPGRHVFVVSSLFLGISYLSFRSSYLVLEIRSGTVPKPSFWEYIGFVFFAPTMSVGPISPYAEYRRSFHEGEREDIPWFSAALRTMVGAVKFGFFGPLLNQLTYSGLLLDGYRHPWIDLPIAVVAYYLYLYCNFSGFCDIAIGIAGLIGISVRENFANPFAARNVKDFWNRWHITLSVYMRDIVFAPLSKKLTEWFGLSRVNHAVAVAIVVTFLLVGVWHGVGWNFAFFGAAHALGVVVNHYYNLGLKRWLGRERLAAYNRSKFIRAASVALTFLYVAATLFFFANNGPTMRTILSAMGVH